MRTFTFVCVAGLLCGCTINAEGPRLGVPPPAVQGSDDVQGAPLSVPGAGMGVGAGSTASPGSAGGTDSTPTGR
jgi:hypothetical protein